jgi:hypothetical protein
MFFRGAGADIGRLIIKQSGTILFAFTLSKNLYIFGQITCK